VQGRDGDHALDPQAIELVRLAVAVGRVGLVGDVDHGLLRATQQIDLGVVGARGRQRRVEHTHDQIGLGDGDVDLALDPLAHGIFALGIEAAGVDHRVAASAREHVAVVAVARDPGLVVHDRGLLAHEAVEQRALADVRPPHDGDDARRRQRGEDLLGLGATAPAPRDLRRFGLVALHVELALEILIRLFLTHDPDFPSPRSRP
jgi:hypothetical protein